jgi:hypothetical protein
MDLGRLLSDPQALLILCCVGGLVLSIHLALFSWLVGDRTAGARASKWSAAFGGGQAGSKRQEGELEELRRRVTNLPDSQEKRDDE